MIEQGKVIKSSGDIAEVEMPLTLNCHKCQVCLFVTPDKRIIKVQNRLSAKIGDSVKVFIGGNKIIAGFLLYILPLISFFIFLILSTILFHIKKEPASALIGFAGMILCYFFIIIFLNTRKFKSHIIEIINSKITD